MNEKEPFTLVLRIVPTVLVLSLGGAGYWYAQQQNARYAKLETTLATYMQTTASTTDALNLTIKTIEQNLSQATDANRNLTTTLSQEQDRAAAFQKEIDALRGSVGTINKLLKTDPELLQKYSKVFFLNEHYVPASLADIDSRYLFDTKKIQKIHTGVIPYFNKMIADAQTEGVTLLVKSAYRSFYDQVSLKSTYTVVYGAGTANKFSADQGYSEHQLGTTIDFTTPELKGQLTGFEKTKAYTWLQENAHRYGFVISYPKNNTYYVYEPWHWRFIGIDLANKLHNEQKNFYDADQRTIDEYLISIFN